MKHTATQFGWSTLGIATALATAGCGDDGTADSTTGVMTVTASGTDTDGSSTSGDSDDSDATSDGSSSTTSDTTTSTTDPSTTDDSTGGTDDSTGGSTGDGTTGGGLMPQACPADDLGMAIPGAFEGSTEIQENELMGTCGGAGAPDIAFTFTAPETGPYTFDTFGSAYDTVLYILDGVCQGEELACDDDGLGGGDSVVSVNLVADQQVTVVVDGFGLFGDDFEVHVGSGQIACPRDDLGSTVPATIVDSTILAEDEFDASCANGTSGDFGYTFTAPATGSYIFDTLGSDFNTVVGIFDGSCDTMGTELACNDNAATGITESVAQVNLNSGQTVTVVVEGSYGASGDLQLNVGELAGTCPDTNLGTAALPVMETGSTATAENTTLGDCGGYTSPDETFLWTAPSDGTYIFDTEGSNYDTVLYVSDAPADDCTGTELACNNDVGGGDTWSQVALDLTANQTIAVTVDGAGDSGNYTLNISQLQCPGPELTGALPLTQAGTTAGLINALSGSCGGGSAPETTFLFTAPADAMYTFDTFGSSYDTVLYLLDGNTCQADTLVCDDDENGLQSQVQAMLTMGQQVVVVVDGFSSNSGAFTLNIAQN